VAILNILNIIKEPSHLHGDGGIGRRCSLAASLKTPTGCFLNARPYHPGINYLRWINQLFNKTIKNPVNFYRDGGIVRRCSLAASLQTPTPAIRFSLLKFGSAV